MSIFSDLVKKERPLHLENASGGKSGALIATYEGGVKALIKTPKERLPSGHRRQRGIASELHPAREAAFYQAAKLLGFADLVPETVLTKKAVNGCVSSAQLFIPAHHLHEMQPKLNDVDDPEWGTTLMEVCVSVPRKFWRSLLALDVLGGSRDRHANNVGVVMRSENDRPIYRIVAWDNAVSFGETFDRYHNVFHKYLFRRSVDLADTWPALESLTRGDLHDALDEYVEPALVEHAFKRVRFFLDFPYRLPFKVCSKGHDGVHDFPDYRPYFEPVVERPLHLLRIPA